MPRSPDSAATAATEAELRLPRPPGVIRRFWGRHPLLTDILIALVGLLLLTAGPVSISSGPEGVASVSYPAVHWLGTAIGIAAAAALLVRRRWPLVAFALGTVAQAALLAEPNESLGFFLILPAYALAVYGSSRLCWIACGAAAVILSGAALGWIALGAAAATVLTNAIAAAALALIGVLVGVNVRNRRRYLAAVIARSRQLVVERDQQAQLAAAAERARIAREMHDVVSHSLTVIVALAEGASATPDADRARDAMDAVASTARAALGEMRTMLGVLRDGDADAPLSPGRPVSPHDVVAAAQRADYPAVLTWSGPADLPDPIRYAVGRIVQEGVTNAMRHAPAATTARIMIDRATDAVTVTVANDGAVRASVPGGQGIRGLTERVASVGGTLSAGPDGKGGWRLTAVLPLPAADDLSKEST